MHEPLKYAISRALTGLVVKHDVESGAPFTGERNLSMDVVIRPGALDNASSSAYRHKGILTPRCDARRSASTSTLLAEWQRD